MKTNVYYVFQGFNNRGMNDKPLYACIITLVSNEALKGAKVCNFMYLFNLVSVTSLLHITQRHSELRLQTQQASYIRFSLGVLCVLS